MRQSRGIHDGSFQRCRFHPLAGRRYMFTTGPVATLTVDSFRNSVGIDRRLPSRILAVGDLRVPVVTAHAFVVDFASKIRVRRLVVSGRHLPETAPLRVPGERKLQKTTLWRAVDIAAGVIPGAHHVVNLFFHHVDVPAVGPLLIAPNKVLSFPFERQIVTSRRLVAEGLPPAEIRGGVFGRQREERASHPGLPERRRGLGVARNARRRLGIPCIAAGPGKWLGAVPRRACRRTREQSAEQQGRKRTPESRRGDSGEGRASPLWSRPRSNGRAVGRSSSAGRPWEEIDSSDNRPLRTAAHIFSCKSGPCRLLQNAIVTAPRSIMPRLGLLGKMVTLLSISGNVHLMISRFPSGTAQDSAHPGALPARPGAALAASPPRRTCSKEPVARRRRYAVPACSRYWRTMFS